MDTPDTTAIDQAWPPEDLVEVEYCPYCKSPERTLAHRDVQDWSFYSSPGKWNYWSCTQCRSLYLSPRPTPATLERAYGSYYTHRVGGSASLAKWVEDRLRNEYWSHELNVALQPRLHLPRVLRWLLAPLKARLIEPFELGELARRPAGRLMDVGCGNGYMLIAAKALGWQTYGMEVDPAAARVARSRGLDVYDGSYSRLTELPLRFDCIICSHVLEHVFEPLDLLATVAQALVPGGTLLLSTPNATSLLRDHFGNNWRGLEAPRHLSVPSMAQLERSLRDVGFTVAQRQLTRPWTAAESSRIQRRDIRVTAYDKAVAKKLSAEIVFSDGRQYDFVELACVRSGHVA